MRRVNRLVAAFGPVLVGCGETVTRDQAVPIEQVPPKAMKVAQETLPDIKFDSAWKIKVNGQDAYEIKGKAQNGKVREVEVTPEGTVIEVE